MSQSHGIKGEITNEAYQEQCFLWERGASVGAFHFKKKDSFKMIFLPTQEHLWNTEGKKKTAW